jgi:hypothetical protein
MGDHGTRWSQGHRIMFASSWLDVASRVATWKWMKKTGLRGWELGTLLLFVDVCWDVKVGF